MNAQALENLALANDLHKAIEAQELYLMYQPLVDVKTKQITSAEALIRWQHPIRGMVSPLDFIGIAEETGLIMAIGEWVLKTACAQNKAWQEKGLGLIKVAVNVSGIQFKQSNLLEIVTRTLSETQFDPKSLDIELTEGSIMGTTHTYIHSMNELKKMGVGLVIDDFGTGYSNLGYLKKFPVNKIKIDKSFIRDLKLDEDDKAIVKAIIAMAQQLKLRVVAEGVETREQFSFLQAYNCDEIQGFYFSPPLKPEEFEKILMQQENQNNILSSHEKWV